MDISQKYQRGILWINERRNAGQNVANLEAEFWIKVCNPYFSVLYAAMIDRFSDVWKVGWLDWLDSHDSELKVRWDKASERLDEAWLGIDASSVVLAIGELEVVLREIAVKLKDRQLTLGV